MKKVLALLLAVLMIVSLTACGAQSTEDKNDSSVNGVVSNNNTGWKEFLKDYEEWVDDYIALTKKYKDNPTDTSILSEYTEMAAEVTEWAERADDLESELSAAEAAEYAEELAKIASKLAEVA